MMEAEDRTLLAQSVQGSLVDTDDPDAALQALGWPEMLVDAPREATEIVFAALGTAVLRPTVINDVLASVLGSEVPIGTTTIVLPSYDATTPPAVIDDRTATIDGLVVPRGSRLDVVWVPCESPSGRCIVEVPSASLDTLPIAGIDPDVGLVTVQGSIEATTVHELDPGAWDGAVIAAQRALGQQILGSGRRMLELARDHAIERVQFGRPVASFQAVRHRLAEAFVALEAADAALVAAWDTPGELTAALAKSLAGRAGRVAAAASQQVLAGIGFTAEHELHRHVRRVAALDGLFGSSASLPRWIGARLVAARTVPRLIDV